jgi:RNA polymerase sigma-70 factor (ECF subfamily)
MKKKAELTEQKVGFAHPIEVQRDVSNNKEHLEQRRDSLAARLKAGNRKAAAELVDIYYQQIFLFMRRLGHSGHVSEDLTQQSFLQAWQHIGQLRDSKALNGWLYRIAGNVSKLHWRKHKADRLVSLEGIDVPQGGETESGKIGDYEQLGRLKNAVVRLPGKLRQVVVLHYMQHLTIAEAAEAAGVRQGTFKSRLNRALNALRKQVVSERQSCDERGKGKKVIE